MKLLSATDVAIGLALKRQTLYLAHGWSDRLQEPYATIEDDKGVIEAHLSMEDAQARVRQIASQISPAT